MFFRDVINHKELKSRLIRNVRENRISHAQLFLGPTGSGGLALALAFARYIHCTGPKEADSCGNCPSCLRHSKLIHPDLHFVYPIAIKKGTSSDTYIAEWREAVLANPYMEYHDWSENLETENKALTIGTEESTGILKKLNLTAFEAEYKIMIIWLADLMNIACSNKLLKMLEEPPDKTLIILVAEKEEKILPTIMSRTQLLKILPLSDSDIAAALTERKKISQQEAAKTAWLAEGNFNSALGLLRDGEEKDLLQIFRNWMLGCLRFDREKINDAMETFAKMGRDGQTAFLNYSLGIFRECLVLSYGSEDLARVTGEERDFILKFSKYVHAGNFSHFMEDFNEAIVHLERNGSAKIIFSDLSFRNNTSLHIPATSPVTPIG